MNDTLTASLTHAARSTAGIRFLDRGEQATFFSFDEIHRRALSVAAGLERHGIASGDRVGIVLPTGIHFLDAFFGVLFAGAIPAPLYPPLRLGRLEEYHQRTSSMLKAVDARLVLTDRRLLRLLGRTIRMTAPSLGCLVMDDLRHHVEASPRPRSASDLALIQFSSGTTAAPKPVGLTHEQILANVRVILDVIFDAYPEGPDLTHAGLSWLPLYHDMGLIGCLLVAVAGPGELTLLPPELFVARPALWLRAVSRFRATVSPAPHFAYNLCAERVRDDELEGVDLSSWRLALDGAEPISSAVLDRFIERFRPYGLREEALTPVYGLAEATLAVTFSNPRERYRSLRVSARRLAEDGVAVPVTGLGRDDAGTLILVSVGRPLRDYRVRIVDDRQGELPPGRLGRVLVRGPSLMSGYQGLREETASVLREGWLDTGDTGFLHDGELYLYGRTKDLVILRGRNYAPQDIERAVGGVEGLRAGCLAAIGVLPHDGEREELVLLVERRRDASAEVVARLPATLRARLAEAMSLTMDRVVVLEPGTLPRTSSGKIRRGEARRRYLTGTLGPPASVSLSGLVKEMARSAISLRGTRLRPLSD